MVYSGMVDWSAFEDRGRVPVNAYFEHDIPDALKRTLDSYRLDAQIDQPTHIEVWTEKDAISGILRQVTLPLCVPLVINKGYNSSTAMYNAYRRFCSVVQEGRKVKILYFGDHDPSGLDMVRDIKDRLIFMFANGERLAYQYGDHDKDTFYRRMDNWWQENEFNIYEAIDKYPQYSYVKLKRKGIMKWLEDKKFIKPKTEGFALMVRDWDRVDILSSNKESVISITSTKVNGLR